MRTPFEKSYKLWCVFYSETLDWGLFIRDPASYFRPLWGHAEADVLWYDIGPFTFFTSGRFYDWFRRPRT